jgi:hypothetical protein
MRIVSISHLHIHPVRKETPTLGSGVEAPTELSNGVHLIEDCEVDFYEAIFYDFTDASWNF